MVAVTFYEKTGCSGNARQKALLAASGHEVQARDLRHTAWTNAGLLALIPPASRRLVEIGCSTGAMARAGRSAADAASGRITNAVPASRDLNIL